MSEPETTPAEHVYMPAISLPGKPKPFNPIWLLRIAWSMLRRRWKLLGAAFILALIAGAFGCIPLTEKVWKGTSLLLYTPTTIPDQIKAMRASLELTNVSGFAASRPVLERVKNDLGLAFPVDILSRELKVESSRNSSTVFFSLSWGDQTEVEQILQRLMIVYPEYVAEVRQQIAQAMLDEAELQIEGVRGREKAARNAYRDFTRENKIIDFKQDLTLLQTSMLSLETKLSQAKRDEQTFGDQVKLLDGHINSIREEQSAEAEANKEFEAANESLADNRRRQNRLRELITEERRVLDVTAQINVKRREYERAKLLAEKSLIPNSQLEKVRADLESLISKISESDTVTKWKAELVELDKLVVPKNSVSKKGSPIIQQILFKKLETRLSIAQSQKAQLEIQEELRATNTQIATYQKLRGELQSMEDNIEAIANERKMLEGKAALMRELATAGPTEFSTISPVSCGAFPASSNRKQMFIAVVFVTLMLTGTTVAAFDVLQCGLIPPDVQVQILGLPVVCRQSDFPVEPLVEIDEDVDLPDSQGNEVDTVSIDDTNTEPSDETNGISAGSPLDVVPNHSIEFVRSFALQLRQWSPTYGSVAMFCGLDDSASYNSVICQLAECFAARDNRVLILDARVSEDGLGDLADTIDREVIIQGVCDAEDVEAECLPGLRDWLSFEYDELAEIILPTSMPGVDCVLPGRTTASDDLATLQMKRFFEYARERYSITILLSPTQSVVDIQILASFADVITFMFSSNNYVEWNTGSIVSRLRAVDAPIAGAVQV